MGQLACSEKQHYDQTFAMTPRSRIICRSPCVNTLVDITEEFDELAGAQEPAKRSNAGSNEASTKAPTLIQALTPPFILPISKDLFTKFINVFMETKQAQAQVLAEP